jgi:FtsP/CotA-like multicopper oxidase with cupredoxin domain
MLRQVNIRPTPPTYYRVGPFKHLFTNFPNLQITVHNDMPRNATVHWHGIA